MNDDIFFDQQTLNLDKPCILARLVSHHACSFCGGWLSLNGGRLQGTPRAQNQQAGLVPHKLNLDFQLRLQLLYSSNLQLWLCWLRTEAIKQTKKTTELWHTALAWVREQVVKSNSNCCMTQADPAPVALEYGSIAILAFWS